MRVSMSTSLPPPLPFPPSHAEVHKSSHRSKPEVYSARSPFNMDLSVDKEAWLRFLRTRNIIFLESSRRGENTNMGCTRHQSVTHPTRESPSVEAMRKRLVEGTTFWYWGCYGGSSARSLLSGRFLLSLRASEDTYVQARSLLSGRFSSH